MSAPIPIPVLAGGAIADVQAERVAWLWPGRIPLGKLTVLDGDPGIGKSTLALDVVARISRGARMADETGGGTPGTAMIFTAEDGLGDTVRPRLDALGADVSRIFAYVGVALGGDSLPVTLPTHLAAIRTEALSRGARLVVIDPLMAYLSGEVNSRIDHDMRRVLAPVANLAEDTGAAILVVRHLNKASGGSALYRGGGSIGIIGAARSGLLVARDPDSEQRRVLAVVKSNLHAPVPSLSFELVEAANGAAIITWAGASRFNATQLLAGTDGEERSATAEAVAFLREELASGPRPVQEVTKAARAAGISERTLERARTQLGVRARKPGGPGFPWVLELKDAGSIHPGGVGGVCGLKTKAAKTAKGVKTVNNANTAREINPDSAGREALRDGA